MTKNSNKLKLKESLTLSRSQQIMLGVFLILFSILTFASLLSYFNTWRIDQSDLENFFDKDIDSVNIAKKFGAILSHFLIYRMFGIASFIFSILVLSISFLFLLSNSKKLINKCIKERQLLIWFSFFFGHFFENKLLAGSIGYEMTEFISIYIGEIGIISILVFGLFTYLVVRINLTPEKTYNWLKKLWLKNKTSFDINDGNNQFEKEIVKNEITLDSESKSKFEIKKEELKPTIENFSSINKTKSKVESKSDDKIEIEIETNETEETLDEDSIAKNLVKKFGEYDHTLELKNFQSPSIELLKDYDNGGVITINQEELEENKEKINETLKNYKIEIDQIMPEASDMTIFIFRSWS